MIKNEIKKDLYKSKEMARMSHYDGDKSALVYHVKIFEKMHEFPIYVMETDYLPGYGILGDKNEIQIDVKASDLKGAKFFVEIKGSDLNRWIGKALDKGELVSLEA